MPYVAGRPAMSESMRGAGDATGTVPVMTSSAGFTALMGLVLNASMRDFSATQKDRHVHFLPVSVQARQSTIVDIIAVALWCWRDARTALHGTTVAGSQPPNHRENNTRTTHAHLFVSVSEVQALPRLV